MHHHHGCTREDPQHGVDKAIEEVRPNVRQTGEDPVERLDDVVAARIALWNHWRKTNLTLAVTRALFAS